MSKSTKKSFPQLAANTANQVDHMQRRIRMLQSRIEAAAKKKNFDQVAELEDELAEAKFNLANYESILSGQRAACAVPPITVAA